MRKWFLNTKTIIFVILAVMVLFFLPKIIGILLLFFTAYVIAAALNPYVNKLQAKMNRGIATTIVITTGIVGIIAALIPIFILTFKEAHVFANMLPQKLNALYDFMLMRKINGQSIADMVDLNSIMGSSGEVAHNIVNQSINITVGFAQVCVIIVALTMIIFYLLLDKSYLRTKFIEFFPSNMKDKASSILSSITYKVGNYVSAQIFSMIVIAVLMMLCLSLLGIEYAFLLGLISGVLDLIPVLGPTIALAIIVLVAAPLGITKVILAVIAFLAVQQLSNYVIRPFMFGKFMALHPLMVFFALFVTEQFLGVWGVILAPAIAAMVCVLIDELYLIPINKGQDIEEQPE